MSTKKHTKFILIAQLLLTTTHDICCACLSDEEAKDQSGNVQVMSKNVTAHKGQGSLFGSTGLYW